MEQIQLGKRKKNYYATIENYIATDLRLKANSVRFLLYISGKPEGWIVRRTDVMHKLNWSKDTYARTMTNLEETGYVQRFHYNSQVAKQNGTLIVHTDPGENPDYKGEMPEDYFTTKIQKKDHSREETAKPQIKNKNCTNTKTNNRFINEKFKDTTGKFRRGEDKRFTF